MAVTLGVLALLSSSCLACRWYACLSAACWSAFLACTGRSGEGRWYGCSPAWPEVTSLRHLIHRLFKVPLGLRTPYHYNLCRTYSYVKRNYSSGIPGMQTLLYIYFECVTMHYNVAHDTEVRQSTKIVSRQQAFLCYNTRMTDTEAAEEGAPEEEHKGTSLLSHASRIGKEFVLVGLLFAVHYALHAGAVYAHMEKEPWVVSMLSFTAHSGSFLLKALVYFEGFMFLLGCIECGAKALIRVVKSIVRAVKK